MFLKDFKIMNGYWISPNPFFKSFGMIMYYPVVLLIWSITFTGFLPWPHPIIALRMLPSPSFWPPEWGELTNRPSPPRGHHTRNKRPLCFVFFFYWTQIIFFINLDRHKIWQHWKQEHFSDQTVLTGEEFITHRKGKAVLFKSVMA